MFFNLKVTYLNDYVKITSVKLKTSSDAFQARFYSKQIEKSKNNIVRAKNAITDIVLANDFKYFFTLTFNTNYDRFDLSQLRSAWKKQLRLIRELYHIDVKYLIVPEQHKNGAWHFHGFFNENIQETFKINENGYIVINELVKLGFHNVQKIEKKERVASYVTKYISKNLANGIKGFKHSYFCSLGLSKGLTGEDIIYNNEHFNNSFFDYGNDFCYRKILKREEFNKILPFIKNL